MPQLPQAHFCKTCGETDPSKFVGRLKGRCYECYKKECRRRYAEGVRLINPLLCKICGTTDPCNFFPNGGTKCKRCLHPNKKIKQPKKEKPIPVVKLPKYTCRKCGKTGKENFYKNAGFICAECYNAHATLYYYPFYNDLIKAQGNRCAMCGKTPQELGKWRLAVDHDHQTNLVRGLFALPGISSLDRPHKIWHSTSRSICRSLLLYTSKSNSLKR